MVDYSAIVPRRAAREAAETWLRERKTRFLRISGSPGSGKSVLARLLAGKVALNLEGDESTALPAALLVASYFCDGKDRRSINPHAFCAAVAEQLAAARPAFAEALLAVKPHNTATIVANPSAGEVLGGAVVGVIINRLILSNLSAEDAFHFAVREPLEVAARKLVEPWIILIDALDEAELYTGEIGIADLVTRIDGLPGNVRFIVTARPDNSALTHRLGLAGLDELRIDKDSPQGVPKKQVRAELAEFLNRELARMPDLVARLAGDLSAAELGAIVAQRADGNFLFASHVLPMLRERPGEIDRTALAALPEGLTGIYTEFLRRLAPDALRWRAELAPLLGALAVAREPLEESVLAGVAGMPVTQARTRLARTQGLLTRDGAQPTGTWRYSLYHRSFAEFLLDGGSAGEYWCSEAEEHPRIVAYARGGAKTWGDVDWHRADIYVLRHLVQHLVAGPAALAEADALIDRAYLVEKLARLGPLAVLDDLRFLLGLAHRAGDLLRTLRFGWLLATWRDRLAQRIAPPLAPIYVKLGELAQAQAMASELDAASDVYLREAFEVQKRIACTLAETGRTDAALEALSGIAADRDKDEVLEQMAAAVVRKDAAAAVRFLALRKRDTLPSAAFCAELVVNPNFKSTVLGWLDRAFGRERSEHCVAIAVALAGSDLERALGLLDAVETYAEDVAGIRFYRTREHVAGRIAEQVAASDPLAGWRIVTEQVRARNDHEVLCVLFAGYLAKADASKACACIRKVEESVLLGILARAHFAFCGGTRIDLGPPDPRRIDIELSLGIQLRSAALDAMSRMNLEGMVRHQGSAQLMTWAADYFNRGVQGLSGEGAFDSKPGAAYFLGRFFALVDVGMAHGFRRFVGRQWANTIAPMQVLEGIASGVAMRSPEEALALFAEHDFRTDRAYSAAVDVLRKRDFEQAMALIATIEPRFYATRANLLGLAAEVLPPNRVGDLRRLIDMSGRYSETGLFADSFDESLRAVARALLRRNGPDALDQALDILSRAKPSAGLVAALHAAACRTRRSDEAAAHARRIRHPLHRASQLVQVANHVADRRALLEEAAAALAEESSVVKGAGPSYDHADRDVLFGRIVTELAVIDAETALRVAVQHADRIELLQIGVSALLRGRPDASLKALHAILMRHFPEFVPDEPHDAYFKKWRTIRNLTLAFLEALNEPQRDEFLDALDGQDESTVPHLRYCRDALRNPSGTLERLMRPAEDHRVFGWQAIFRFAIDRLARSHPREALDTLRRYSSQLMIDRLQSAFKSVLSCLAHVDPDGALAEAHAGPRGSPRSGETGEALSVYEVSLGCRAVAETVAATDIIFALRVVENMPDQVLRQIALRQVIQNRLEAELPPAGDELAAMISAADKVPDEQSRGEAFAALMTARGPGPWFPAFLATDLVARLASGNRTTFLTLLPAMAWFTAQLDENVVSRFESVARDVKATLD